MYEYNDTLNEALQYIYPRWTRITHHLHGKLIMAVDIPWLGMEFDILDRGDWKEALLPGTGSDSYKEVSV